MEVEQVMTTDVVSVTPETSSKEAAELLVATGVSGLPVVDTGERVVGVITEADLVARTAFDGERRRRALAVIVDALSVREHPWVTKSAGWTVAEVMTRGGVTCGPHDDVRTVARRMLDHGVTSLPVIEREVLVGIVARRDLLRALVRPDAEIEADVVRALRDDPNRPDDCHVVATVTDGKVTLAGDVRDAWDAPVVVAMVQGVEGVIAVESHLHHRETAPRTSTPTWPWVTPVH